MVFAAGERRVVVEEVPLALELCDRMMRRPSQDRFQDAACIGERTQGARSRGVNEVVRVSGRVGEVVCAVVLVHPGSLEEAPVMVVCLERLTCLGGQDDQVLHRRSERAHVVVQLGDARTQRGHIARGLLGSRPAGVERARRPALELSAPDPAKVQVGLAVVVDKACRIDAVAARDGLRVWRERTLGTIALCDADAEDALLVARREVQKVLPVLGGGVGRPHLLRHPGDVCGLEGHAVVGHGPAHGVHGQDVVVVHVVLVSIVVVGLGGFDVVRRVDVESAVEDVGGRVRSVDVSNEGLVSGHCDFALFSKKGRRRSARLGNEMERQFATTAESGRRTIARSIMSVCPRG
ncbi:hypothetical protein VTO42DRAFT_1425 [Malbranchea cinnamomea]